MTRRTARELAMLVTASLAPDETGEEALDRFFEEEHYRSLQPEGEPFTEAPDRRQMAYIRALVSGAASRRGELDEMIRAHARGWRVERLSSVVRAVLRCAMMELDGLPEEYRREVPPRVAINEAVELAKKYGSEDAPGFVNGILGSIARARDAEAAAEAGDA